MNGRSRRSAWRSKRRMRMTLPLIKTSPNSRGNGRWMRVKWLRKALANLDTEATYIATEDLAAARLVVERVLKAVNRLAEQPALGRPGRAPGTRELIVAKTR